MGSCVLVLCEKTNTGVATCVVYVFVEGNDMDYYNGNGRNGILTCINSVLERGNVVSCVWERKWFS